MEKSYTTCRIIRVNPKGQQITPSPSDKLAAIRNKSSNSYKHKASFSSLLLRARLRLSLDHEPITCRKQLYLCHGVLLTSLFLELVWRDLKYLESPTNQSAKPTDFKMVFLDFWWRFVLLIHYLILRMRPWTDDVSSFAGRTALKINRSVKTPWHNPSLWVAHYRTVLKIVLQWVDCFHTHDHILRGVAFFFTRMYDHRLQGVACFHTHDHRLHGVAFFSRAWSPSPGCGLFSHAWSPSPWCSLFPHAWLPSPGFGLSSDAWSLPPSSGLFSDAWSPILGCLLFLYVW